MKWILTYGTLLVLFATLFALTPRTMAGEMVVKPIKVGIYDSRLVALAYGRSAEFRSHISDLKAQHKAAMEAGDGETVERLEAEGPALQDQLHKQVFGNAPIPGIMKEIEKALPAIALEAGVDMIVCKWDVAWQRDDVDYVDVSLAMMKLFDPSEETLRIAEEARNTPPVPLEELEAHHH